MLHNQCLLVIRIIHSGVCVLIPGFWSAFLYPSSVLGQASPEPEAQGTVMGIVVLTPQETVLSPNMKRSLVFPILFFFSISLH